MSIDARFTTPDLLDRLQRHFAVEMPPRIADDVDRRVQAAIASTATRSTRARDGGRRGWPRRRIVAILSVAAILAAASPAIRFFEGWGEEFDRVFALSTPIDQSATDDGYRVTVVRAYADSFGVRLAITAEDLEDRGFAELAVGNPTVTDDEGCAVSRANPRSRHMSQQGVVRRGRARREPCGTAGPRTDRCRIGPSEVGGAA